MSLFPTTVNLGIPQIDSMWNTTITPMKSGKENRTQNWIFPKRQISIPFPNITETDLKTILNFFNNDCKGARYAFHLKWPVEEIYKKEYVDQGDSGTTTFTLPFSEGTAGNTYIYLDDVLNTGYTFSSGTGIDGMDQVVFTTAPSDGVLITCTSTAKWTPLVRFSDKMTYQYLLNDLVSIGKITLYEVRS